LSEQEAVTQLSWFHPESVNTLEIPLNGQDGWAHWSYFGNSVMWSCRDLSKNGFSGSMLYSFSQMN